MQHHVRFQGGLLGLERADLAAGQLHAQHLVLVGGRSNSSA